MCVCQQPALEKRYHFHAIFTKLTETIEITELNQLVHRVQWLIFSPWARPRSWNRNHMNLSLFLTINYINERVQSFLLFSSIGRFLFFQAKTIKWPRFIFLFNGNAQKIRKFKFIWICRLQILNWRWKKNLLHLVQHFICRDIKSISSQIYSFWREISTFVAFILLTLFTCKQ